MPWIGSSVCLAAVASRRSGNRLIVKSLLETLVNSVTSFS